jgi:TniQ
MSCSRWPLHPHSIREECLLSWLTRIARCYEISLNDLLQHDLGFQGKVDDLNIQAPAWLLSLLSQRTGVSEQNIRAMTLSSFSPLLFDGLNEDADFESYVHHYSLLLPLKHRMKFHPKNPWLPWLNTRALTLTKACPICIENAPAGVLLLVWYLPCFISCPVHRCLLRPCHTYQGSHVSWIYEGDPLTTLVSEAIHIMDQRTWSALTIGQVSLPRRIVHGGVWLRLLRTLLDELHISLSSTDPIYARNIVELWESEDLPLRGGKSCWKPYEALPTKLQEHTLVVAAKAFHAIEKQWIRVPGEQAFLFLPDEINRADLGSYPEKTLSTPTLKQKSPLENVSKCLEDAVELAKRDPEEALNLRRLLLFGKKDPQSIQEANGLLIEAGVPQIFLDP